MREVLSENNALEVLAFYGKISWEYDRQDTTKNFMISLLAGWWFGTVFIFPYVGILGIIIPTDFHIFQRG